MATPLHPLIIGTLFWSIALAGCLGTSSSVGGNEPPEPVPCDIDFGSPLLLGDAGPGSLASEPAIAFGPDGEIAVSSIWIPAHLLAAQLGGQITGLATSSTPAPSVEPGGQNAVWVSEDGETFVARHDELGRLSLDGHQGNQDADLAFTPDGSLHVALFGPSGIEVLSSTDLGETWTPSGLLSPQGVDRQWIEVDETGNLLVSWYEFNSLAGLGQPGDGVGLATSEDYGHSWKPNQHAHETAFPRGPLRNLPGYVMLPVNDDGMLYILATTDGGKHWSQYGTALTTNPEGYPGFEVLTESGDTEISMVWTEQDNNGTASIWIRTISSDGWGTPIQTSPEGHNAAFGWPVLRPDGSFTVFSYQSSQSGDPVVGERTWDLAYDLRCPGTDDWQHGVVAENVHVGSMCFSGGGIPNGCPIAVSPDGNDERNVGEIFEAGVAPDGRVWVTWTTTQTSGTNENPAKVNQIWIAGENAS